MFWRLLITLVLASAECGTYEESCFGGVALLQSSAKEVRSSGQALKKNQAPWSDFGGLVRWTDVDNLVQRIDPAPATTTSSSLLVRVLVSTAVLVVSASLLAPFLFLLLAAGGTIAQALGWPLSSGKSNVASAAKVPDSTATVGLLPPRAKVSWPWLVTSICLMDVLLNVVFILLLLRRQEGVLESPHALLSLVMETLVGSMFFLLFARWDDQRHIITAWQVLQSIRFFLIRRTIYLNPGVFIVSMLLLLLVSSVGVVAELFVDNEVRVPPYEPKKMDFDRPAFGWLGPYADWVQSKYLRWLITAFFCVADQMVWACFLYMCTSRPEEDMEQVSDDTFKQLVRAAMLLQMVALFPFCFTHLHATYVLVKQWCDQETLLRAYRTGPYDVPMLEDELTRESVLKTRLQTHKCRSITVVVPAYMPNEEDIVLECLDAYRREEAKYPGIMRVMLVWNSPQEHTWIEQQLEELQESWPAFSVHRNHMSTSKCDNLNMAISLLETDFALFNDVDTMVSAASMCRASLHLFEENHSAVQSYLVHCWEDFSGIQEAGCFPFGAVVTGHDGVLPSLNESVYGHMQLPFCNGRGSFWRSDAIKMIGFDHRTIAEDHDAMFRAKAYYGFTGVSDINILCQEREPPDFGNVISQRTRWMNGQMQKLRALSWAVRSQHMSPFLKIYLVYMEWISRPFQGFPFILAQWAGIWVMKARATEVNPLIAVNIFEVEVKWPVFALVIYVIPLASRYAASLLASRYRPRWLGWIMSSLLVPLIYNPVRETFVRFRMLHDFLWSSKLEFVCTTRDKTPSHSPSMSPSSSFFRGPSSAKLGEQSD
ncbi:unnamed protein product [Effrenium voratum]|nr:unnamed protein product [Effrenium voratum]